MRKVFSVLGIAIIGLSLMGVTPAAAQPNDGDSVADYLAKNPHVLVADPAALKSDTAVLVAEEGRVVDVIGDSNLAARSEATASASAMAACGYRASSYVTLSYTLSVDGCSIIGVSYNAAWYYDWYQPNLLFNAGSVCTQARGYYTGNSVTRWYPSGCGTSGGATAHIGETITVAKMRGYVGVPGKVGYTQWH